MRKDYKKLVGTQPVPDDKLMKLTEAQLGELIKFGNSKAYKLISEYLRDKRLDFINDLVNLQLGNNLYGIEAFLRIKGIQSAIITMAGFLELPMKAEKALKALREKTK